MPEDAAHAEDGGNGKADDHAEPQSCDADAKEAVAEQRGGEANQPVAYEGVNHRHPCVVDAAQDACGADLHPVANLENADEDENDAGDGDDVGVGAVERGDFMAQQQRDGRHYQHDDGDDNHAAECALAQCGVVAFAVGVAAADGERVGKPQRDHEGNAGVVERNLVGGGIDRIGAADDEADGGKKAGFHDQRQRNRQADAEIAADGGEVRTGEALVGAVWPPARVAGNGGEDESGEDAVAERGGERHAGRAHRWNGPHAVEKNIVADDIGRDEQRLHQHGGARKRHAFEETASGEADDADARAGGKGEQVAAGFAGDVRRAAEPGGDARADDGQHGGGGAEKGEHPDALLEIAADLRAVIAAIGLRNGGGDGKGAARHEQIDEAEDLRGERH